MCVLLVEMRMVVVWMREALGVVAPASDGYNAAVQRPPATFSHFY